MSRSYVICKEIRNVANGFIVVIDEPYGLSEHICATWSDVVRVLSNKACQPVPVIPLGISEEGASWAMDEVTQ